MQTDLVKKKTEDVRIQEQESIAKFAEPLSKAIKYSEQHGEEVEECLKILGERKKAIKKCESNINMLDEKLQQIIKEQEAEIKLKNKLLREYKVDDSRLKNAKEIIGTVACSLCMEFTHRRRYFALCDHQVCVNCFEFKENQDFYVCPVNKCHKKYLQRDNDAWLRAANYWQKIRK